MTSTEEQIIRVVDAFAHEMTDKFWDRAPKDMTREEFRVQLRSDLERLAVIVRAIR